MKLAIIGTINPTLSYHDWVRIFRHHFWKKSVSEFRITGGDTLLNSYVRKYAVQFSIPISVFNCLTDEAESKLARNNALIDDADMVVAFTTRSVAKISRVEDAGVSYGYGKNALVVFADEPIASNQSISNCHMDYSDDTRREDLLTVEEEVALVRQIKAREGDVDAAKDRLLLACRRFVKTTAMKYVTANHPIEELIAEGNKGLIQAAYEYDPSQGFKFTTYAIRWIRQSIEEALSR
ncbi:MAG: hypothetical protein K2I64_06660 [Muribaculaceae bacterium]|nr:hypothetical protein [Muribaculaceae bacterium]